MASWGWSACRFTPRLSAPGSSLVAPTVYLQYNLCIAIRDGHTTSEGSVLRIYLDACCFNRPFDDQTQHRVRLEAEATLLILARFEHGQWEMIGSSVLDFELRRMPDRERYRRVRQLIGIANHSVVLDESQILRGSQLESLGFDAYDALHLAAAEAGEAVLFLTTDDRLLQMAKRFAGHLHVRVENPLTWLREWKDR